jgi:hypothetical protein
MLLEELLEELKKIYKEYGNLPVMVFQVSERLLEKVSVCPDEYKEFLVVELGSE